MSATLPPETVTMRTLKAVVSSLVARLTALSSDETVAEPDIWEINYPLVDRQFVPSSNLLEQLERQRGVALRFGRMARSIWLQITILCTTAPDGVDAWRQFSHALPCRVGWCESLSQTGGQPKSAIRTMDGRPTARFDCARKGDLFAFVNQIDTGSLPIALFVDALAE
uniref:Uncharacterized protein n=1 Tax=Plectus sambesii TaxID=2011161 RepID=A0A914VVL2_9BILA